MTNPTDQDADLTGNGWLAGPYASREIAQGVFLDASLLYGGSNNTIDTAFFDGTFDTTRWMFDASVSGDWKLDEVTTLTPRLRTVYLNETVSAYTVSNGAGTSLIIDGFTEDQFRASLGAELKRQFTLENGLKLTPRVAQQPVPQRPLAQASLAPQRGPQPGRCGWVDTRHRSVAQP